MMPATTAKRAPFKSGVRWYSLWDAQGTRIGYERHVVSAVSDGSATIETLTVYRTDKGLSEGTSTLAFGSGGHRLEAVRYTRDGVMGFSLRRDGDLFSGYWAGQSFAKSLPADFLPNFGFAEWVATLPQEIHGFTSFTRLPQGSDTPAPASVECLGEEEVKVHTRIVRAWKYLERAQGKPKNTWWVDKDRNVVKYNFGPDALLEDNETAAKGDLVPKAAPARPGPVPIASPDDPTKMLVEIPKNPVLVQRQATQVLPPQGTPAPATTPGMTGPPRPGAPAGSSTGGPPSRVLNTQAPPPAAPAPAPAPAAPAEQRRPEHVLPAPGRAPTRELSERAPWIKTRRWYSLTNEGKPAGWECHLVSPTGEGALLEVETHYLGQDGKWHDSAAVVVFGSHDRVGNCHFMQDGIQTELGQPFFTLRRIETGFIGTWQGKPYKRSLPDDFVPGFGLHELVASLPQNPGSKKTVQRLAMAQTEPAPCTIECHGEQETELRGAKVTLCKFVERIQDRVRSIWWVDRSRVIQKHFFGLEATLEETEAAAKQAGAQKS